MHCTDCSNDIRYCTCNAFGGNSNPPAKPKARLPENPTMTQEAHGHGANGMAFYTYEAHDLDVILDARRKDGRSPFIDSWRYRWLAGRTFPTYATLREVVNSLSSESIAAERAKWPVMVKDATERIGGSASRCWLHNTAPATHHAWVQTSWHEYDGRTAIICADCAEAAKTDAGIVIRASEKRRADCAARNAAGKGFAKALKQKQQTSDSA